MAAAKAAADEVVEDMDKVAEADVVAMVKAVAARRGEPTTNTPTEDSTTDDANDNAQFLLDNAANLDDIDEDHLQSSLGITDSCLQMLEQANCLNGNVLLINSCSSVNLICNSDLLHDIVTVDWHMRVRCNAGVRTTNQQGRLGNFPEPVWYNPKGVANILSLNSVKKHDRVTYDSAGSDTFVVTDANNSLSYTSSSPRTVCMHCEDLLPMDKKSGHS